MKAMITANTTKANQMSKPIYKVEITEKRFWATVRPNEDGGFTMSLEHMLFGNRVESEHDNRDDAIDACNEYAKKARRLVDVGPNALLAKYGPNLAQGLGPERALEMVENGEVSL